MKCVQETVKVFPFFCAHLNIAVLGTPTNQQRKQELPADMFSSTSCWSLMTTMETPIPVMTTCLCIADMLYQTVIMTSLSGKLQNNYLFMLFSRNQNICVRIFQNNYHYIDFKCKKKKK